MLLVLRCYQLLWRFPNLAAALDKQVVTVAAVVVNREGKLEQTVAAIASVIDAEKLSLRHRSRKGPLSDL